MAKITNRLTEIGDQVNKVKESYISRERYDSIQKDASQATYAMHLRQLLKSGQLIVY